ncbi:hypothetical protein [Clostridium weizhouense]|uniref:Phage XkdN-like protein n=1 Tax=Clostridium weizhouense TaxID=2859781 RepID=A0ABS7AK08_9CLOT|nr:hypothetical protein [Clostridium weizhouense]MBW6408967.1 hypothetical protein [Clostridium weizhouense]
MNNNLEIKNEEVKIEDYVLTIDDIINKKDMLREQATEIHTCGIYCKKLRGSLIAHELDKGDLADARAKMKDDYESGIQYMIYLSIDYLQDSKVLEAYECKTNSHKIVKKLFPRENELIAVSEIIMELNGLSELKPGEILKKEIEDLKN